MVDELRISEVQDGHDHLEHSQNFFGRKIQRLHALDGLELGCTLVDARYLLLTGCGQESEVHHVHALQGQLPPAVHVLAAFDQLLENVLVPLSVGKPSYSALLQQLVHDFGTDYRLLVSFISVVELDLDELAEAR